ncbi:hypothetical protein YERSI8AC_60265 [Enterobacterales bacterium 8AC]|nr:hypothetical protein YERSI8AC_60265 [Enterobacterales bacterium 8AC]
MAKIDENWKKNKPYLLEAANNVGMDPEILVRFAYLESLFNDDARPISKKVKDNTQTQWDGVKAMSTAYGLGQFTDDTWKEAVNKYGAKYGIKNAGKLSKREANEYRADVRLQAAILAETVKERINKDGSGLTYNKNTLLKNYLAHNLGKAGADRFLQGLTSNPNALVNSMMPDGKLHFVSDTAISNNAGLYLEIIKGKKGKEVGRRVLSFSEAYENINTKLSEPDKYVADIKESLGGISSVNTDATARDNLASVLPLLPLDLPVETKAGGDAKGQSSINQPLPLTQEIKDKYKNTLYKYGANGNQANGNTLYDCSHLTHAIGKELGHNVPYQSTAELAKSKYYDIIDPKDVKPGDLALWRGKDNHVGVVETPIGSDGTGTYFSTRGNDKKPGRSGTVKFGPKSGYWKKPTSYLRIKPEYVNQAPIKNTVVAQKKSSPPKVAPAPVVEKNSADIAKEKKLPRGYDLLGGMVSALRQLTVPNLQHATQALLGRQPEDYRSAKGGCCCASGPTSPVINQNTSITLNSACKDPQELGKIVTSAQDRVNRDMVRKITPRTS